MYKKLLSLLCVAAILASMPFAVSVSADTVALCGVTDRAEYKNAGYNTQITITFNKEITSTGSEINAAASLVKYGTSETAGNVKTKLERDKKTLNVYLEGCTLAANTKYTLSFAGIKSGMETADVSVNISTGSINENKYVYENFEGYAKGENWTDKTNGVPDNAWIMTPTYSGAGLKKTDSSLESFPSVKGASISSSTHSVSGSYTNAYSDLTVDVRQDPTNAANNVLYYDAGNQQGYDGNLYIRLVKKPCDGAASVAVPTSAKLVHGFKVYVPADGYSYYTNDYNIGKKNLFGVISNEGNYSDTYTNSMLYIDANRKLSFRRGKDGPNYRYQTLEADTWYDIKYVANASIGTYDIYMNGTKIAENVEKNKDLTSYYGLAMAIAPVYNADGKSPKMYYDDLKSYILENLTAADGTTANKNKFSASSDKVIINFSSEIDQNTLNDALTVKKADGTAVNPAWNVEWKDNGTTAVISFADGLDAETAYSLTLSNALKDIFGQTLSNASAFSVNFTTGFVPAQQQYLINDNFEDIPEGNWIGSGYPTGVTDSVWWVAAGTNGNSGDNKDNATLKYSDGTTLTDAEIGVTASPDGSTNKVFKYSSGTINADSIKSYRVVRRINGTNGFTVDRSKQLVAKYKIWFENNVPAALGTTEKRTQKIPEFATSASGVDTAMQTNVRAVAASDGTIDNSKVKLYHQRYNATGTIDTGKWAELTYVITPAAENDTTGKMKYSIYLDGKPLLTDFASDENALASDATSRYKLYGFKFNIIPEKGITTSGTMYIDDLQMYQTPAFTTATSLSGLVSTAEPITVNFNNAICSDQYDKTTKTVVPFDNSFVSIVTADNDAVIGHPSVKLIDGGYGVELDISELNLTKGKEYKVVFSDDLRDVSYQSFVQPATDLTFTPSDSNDVYLSEIADPTVAATSVTTAFKISNPTTETKSIWYAVAVYGDYNELIGITSLDPKNPLQLGGGQETENILIAVSAASGADFTTSAKKVKIFLWDDCVDMNPYGEAEVFNYTK